MYAGHEAEFKSIAQALQEERAAHEQKADSAEQERIRLVTELANLQAAVSDAAAEVEERTSKALEGGSPTLLLHIHLFQSYRQDFKQPDSCSIFRLQNMTLACL